MASRVFKNGTHRITQVFSSGHKAVDVVGNGANEPVIAHTAGRVVFCQTGQKNNRGSKGNASYGNCVKLDHGEGWTTLYAHLATVAVKLGDTVKQGQVIGTMGDTGNSYGAHLHFEVRKDNLHRDPVPYLDADLPLVGLPPLPTVTYKAYCGGWLPPVTGFNEISTSGYAGIRGKPMTALTAKPTAGSLTYRVHLTKGGWLPWVTDDTDFAGVRGKAFDAVQMKLTGAPGYEVKYRVSSTATLGKWYGWCVGLTDATGDGYAGVFGKPVDRIQITVVRR